MTFEAFRTRAYEIIEPKQEDDTASAIYDYSMMAIIVLNLIPLAFKNIGFGLTILDRITAAIFIADYALRLLTADKKLTGKKKKCVPFLLYPLTPLALIDLISILPSFFALNSGIKLFRLVRLARAFRVFRAFKMLRYSKNVRIIINVVRRQKSALIAVCSLAGAYILIAALVVFNVEPQTFDNFFMAIYWATISLTTMGYGDIYPVTTAGQIVTMLSSLVGIAIVAMPAGILTAGYMEEIRHEDEEIFDEEDNF